MFEIDVCYKFIFESMLEDDVLGYIANKVYEYTHAGIFFVSESGEILAYACSGKDQSMRSIIEGHVTLEDYPYFFEEVSPNGEFQTVAAVKDKKKNIGYIIIHYSNEEFWTFFEELGTILTETARQYFEEKQKNTYLNLSLKDYIIGWMIFEGQHFVESEQSHTLKGNYLMALFTDDFSDMAVEAAKLGRIWEHFYLYEEKHFLTVVLYQVSEKNAQKIYQMAQKENLNCYMSETFEDINDCRTKRDLLKQMERIPKICDVRGVKREKDWYLQGIFSYTLPLIEEAGLSDYSILNLIKEDEKNHTELYDTVDAQRIVHECLDGVWIEAVILDDQRKIQVQELADILAKSFSMYQKNRKNTGNNQKRQPDYLWILATDTSLAARLAGKIEETKEFSSVVEKQKDNSILITNIRGKEDRALLIRLCKEFIYDCDGKILIGNGVKAEQNLSENKRLQQEVFELARNRAPGKHLYLIEQYYHELAISYISRKVGENGFKLKELEQIRCEDEETGRNLYETLYWYLRMKRNVSQTAAKLKIHRNTLLPRLTRLNDMLDLDNRDGAECEKLLVAMEIDRMKNSDE